MLRILESCSDSQLLPDPNPSFLAPASHHVFKLFHLRPSCNDSESQLLPNRNASFLAPASQRRFKLFRLCSCSVSLLASAYHHVSCSIYIHHAVFLRFRPIPMHCFLFLCLILMPCAVLFTSIDVDTHLSVYCSSHSLTGAIPMTGTATGYHLLAPTAVYLGSISFVSQSIVALKHFLFSGYFLGLTDSTFEQFSKWLLGCRSEQLSEYTSRLIAFSFDPCSK